MAAKRYSATDQARMIRDRLANLRAKRVDAQDIHAIHPEGTVAALTIMERDLNCTRDQSQQQTEEGKSRAEAHRDTLRTSP